MRTMSDQFCSENGIWVPRHCPRHRDAEYDEEIFDIIVKMQRKHFWYQGRHQLLLSVLKHEIAINFEQTDRLQGIDMGGGCGGWLNFLNHQAPDLFQQLALGDSSYGP